MTFPSFPHIFPCFFRFFPYFPMTFPWCIPKWVAFQDPEIAPVEVYLDGLGGGGWQRRPAEPGSLWRVENAVEVPEGRAWQGRMEVEEAKKCNCMLYICVCEILYIYSFL